VLGEFVRKVMPDLASRSEPHLGGIVADRRHDAEAGHDDASHAVSPCLCSIPEAGWSGRRCLGKADLEVGRRVDGLAVGLQPAVGDASTSRPRMTRLKSMPYSTSFTAA
jgi:hypothetical protein